MPTFIGLDLAWVSKNQSGICWLEGDSKENLRCTRLDVRPRHTESLANEIASIDDQVLVTIDAPVRYTPERWSERALNSRFNRYKAGAHSAHAAWKNGYRAGIDLGNALESRGFTCDPFELLRGERPKRSAVEVYPHTIHVRLFGLDERLPYKRRGNDRPVEFRQRVFQRYQRYLTELIGREAPGVLDSAEIRRLLDPENVKQRTTHVELNWIDDALDGVTCAMSAWMMWNEPERWEGIGDQNGCIVVPRDLEWSKPDGPRRQPRLVNEAPPSYRAKIYPREQRPAHSQDPNWSVQQTKDGLDIQITSPNDDSGWKIRVRLEGDDLSRVVTVVERLEEGPGH